MRKFIKKFAESFRNHSKCEHRYIKKVYNFGKNSKPSYVICKSCGEVITWDKLKNRKNGKKKRR